MAKTREIACKYYEYEGCTCSKRGKECHFRKEMQTCGKYEKGAIYDLLWCREIAYNNCSFCGTYNYI